MLGNKMFNQLFFYCATAFRYRAYCVLLYATFPVRSVLQTAYCVKADDITDVWVIAQRTEVSLSGGRSLSGLHVIRTLETLPRVWGAPDCLRSDNGSEVVTRQVKKWLLEHAIGTHYIDPVSPWQIPFIESFNSILRTTFLNRWCFLTLAETKALTQQWLDEYNETRPHGPLGGLSPFQILWNIRSDKSIINKLKLPENLTLEVD